MRHCIICYRQYGEWYATKPWDKRYNAEQHVERQLKRPERDYVKDITIVEVELPE